ncbi:hypothetical protein EDEG_01516 [Edhazardia aedis USNM 41457]|uniref:Uncharacterized protein n=1 Tax=Edhazardia aedis (strain USNM 41457) TaxID=1003232 RepID=J8ZWZ7_EDHAE|nr:hypothetical protein EDEG_01516 [Edhazardia aedis USNM 41457]|eukprot:EJW04198.1 hypothetical protein EDEG_01516 [Edhazardia aedis USNM 41457]
MYRSILCFFYTFISSAGGNSSYFIFRTNMKMCLYDEWKKIPANTYAEANKLKNCQSLVEGCLMERYFFDIAEFSLKTKADEKSMKEILICLRYYIHCNKISGLQFIRVFKNFAIKIIDHLKSIADACEGKIRGDHIDLEISISGERQKICDAVREIILKYVVQDNEAKNNFSGNVENIFKNKFEVYNTSNSLEFDANIIKKMVDHKQLHFKKILSALSE